ncbi:ricin-type beta-trefoil lectin domain protein [Kitasatospora sp. NPDC051705]|uniref:ricin-type beta-trefoil lectin domain protein n=1 Tax=Kitasatospora sp. NPDC051705 TaxID=3364057 RepID=UPI0037999978
MARLAALVSAVTLILGLSTSTASAATPPWDLGNTALATPVNLNAQASGPIRNIGLDKCMDDAAGDTRNGAAVVSYTCNDQGNQSWTFNPKEPYIFDNFFYGTITLTNTPGKCLDVPNPAGDGSGITNGTKLQVWDCNGAKNQQWIMQYASNGSPRIYSPMSYRCVDVPGYSTVDGITLQLWNCNSSTAQWFTPPAAAPQPTGPITNPSLGGKCVDDPWNNPANGTRVQSSQCNGTSAQVWTLNQDGTVTHASQCLDIAGGETAVADGTPVHLWSCVGGLNQQWVVRFDAGGRTTLLNPNSGRCLDVPGGTTSDATDLQLWTCNDTDAQVWKTPQRPHTSAAGPVVSAPVIYPVGTGPLSARLDAIKDAEEKRKNRARLARAMHAGGTKMRTEAGAALSGNDVEMSAVWAAWISRGWADDPNSALSKDVVDTKIADQARDQRWAGRQHFLDDFSMFDRQPDFDDNVISYMSSNSTFWRGLLSVNVVLDTPKANQAAKDRVNAIAKENGAKEPSVAWLWDVYARQTNDGSADDVRRFIQYNGYPTVAPVPGTPEFRIEVEAIKARWASGDATNPFDPKYMLMDAVETAWTEYQNELNSQAQPRADIITAEIQGLEALRTGSEAMNDALSYAWYADRLLWAQQYRTDPSWHAPVERIPHDLGIIKAKVAGLAESAKMAAGQAKEAADKVQAAQDAAAATARSNGAPEGRALTYALQSAQVTKASASAATAVSNAIQTALATTNATVNDSATLLANAKAQAHAARAQFLREMAQGDAKLAASLATTSQERATAAASAAQRAAAAKVKAQAAETTAATATAAAHDSAAKAAKERQNAATAKATADTQRAKAQQAETLAQQKAATAQNLRKDAAAAAGTAAANESAAQQAEQAADTSRKQALTAEQSENAADARASAAEAAAAAAVGGPNAAAARAAADRAKADAAAAVTAANQARSAAGTATIAAGKARKAADAANAASARAKAASDKADSDTAAASAAAADAHAAAADSIEASAQASTNAQGAQTASDQATKTASEALERATAARSEADGAVSESAIAAGKAAATSEAAQQASTAAATVAAPADKAIDLSAPYANTDSAAGLATLASQAAKTVAQQQAEVAQARAVQAADAAVAAQQAADKADGEAKLAAQAAADAAKSAASAAKSSADAMKSAASATADSAVAVQAAAHSDQLVTQAKADQSAAHQSAKDAAGDASSASASATTAERDAAGARKAATTARAAANQAQQSAAAADASATSAEAAIAKAQQDAAAAAEAANRAGIKASADKGWCDAATGQVCANATEITGGAGAPGGGKCDSPWEQYNCKQRYVLNSDYQAAMSRTYGDCANAKFENLSCQPSILMQTAVIAASKANVDPRLVYSIALMETSGKEVPMVRDYGLDVYLEYEKRAAALSAVHLWPGHGGDGVASLGLTNIKPVTWDYIAKAYPNVFKGHEWADLRDQTDLDMTAAAYYVKYLETVELPKLPQESIRDYAPYDLLYGFYNGGIDPSSESYRAFYDAKGDHYGHFGPLVTGNITAWKAHWDRANREICGSGIMTCTFS